MAALTTTFIDAQRTRNTSIYVNPNARPVQATVRFARFRYAGAAAIVSADTIDLGFLGLGKVLVIPELCRIINPTASPNVAATLTLQKVDAAGTVTALTDAAALSANASVALARVAGDLTVPEVLSTDYLRLLTASVTASASGVLDVEIAYTSEEAP